MLRQAIILLLLSAAAGALTAIFHPRAPVYRGAAERSPLAISMAELTALPGDSVLWIDARTAAEHAAGHVPGAILANENDWEAGFERIMMAWQPEQTLVVYCDEAACHSSEAVAQRLRHEMAIESVFFLEGGWGAWKEAQP
jgi:rhodanese-related sulfurtransferase